MTTPVRVRFAPSPTGKMHVGNARTALYSWLHARHTGGTFVLRIEDTDRERSTPENVDFLFDALRWLGIDWDEEPVIQSHRADHHRALLAGLVEKGLAYHCDATKDDVDAYKKLHGHDKGFRGQESATGAIRLRVPEGATVVEDIIRGHSVFEHAHIDDMVIARADGTPLYNFVVAVDDTDMGITHVIRGDDHFSNTPKQLLVMNALGLTPPKYAHLPMIVGADGKKLGKRHGAVSVQDFREQGILPQTMVNYLALLGWGSSGDEDYLPLEDLIAQFDVADCTKAPSRFDEKKLTWLNGTWIRNMDTDELVKTTSDFVGRDDLDLTDAIIASQTKFKTLAEFWPLVAGIYDGPIRDDKAYAKVFGKDENAAARLAVVADALHGVTDWTPAGIEAALHELPAHLEIGAGKLFQPLRVAITGGTISPGIFDTAALLPKSEVMARINACLEEVSASN